MIRRSKLKSLTPLSGELLVGEFRSALANLITMETANAEAQYSEANIENALKYQAANNGVFLTPQDLSPEAAEVLVKNSVDAHLKKVQAEQIKTFTTSQVGQQQIEAEQKYKNRKVRISLLENSKDVLIPLWADKRTGQLREGTFKGNTITGTIDDLALEKNLLVIRPNFAWRTLVPDRKYFLVVVLNMQTLMPNIRIDLN